jgi:hypothetical protein
VGFGHEFYCRKLPVRKKALILLPQIAGQKKGLVDGKKSAHDVNFRRKISG